MACQMQVGASASECDTIPGRQCMASCFFLLKQFDDVLIYLKSIKSYFTAGLVMAEPASLPRECCNCCETLHCMHSTGKALSLSATPELSNGRIVFGLQ